MNGSRRLIIIVCLTLAAILAAGGSLAVAEAAARRTDDPAQASESGNARGESGVMAVVPMTTATSTPTPVPAPRITRFYLSARPDGATTTTFPSGTGVVYVNYEYEFYDAYTVTVELRDVDGGVFFHSERREKDTGATTLAVTTQDAFDTYHTRAAGDATVMDEQLDLALAAPSQGLLTGYVYGALAAASDLSVLLQQVERYTPPAAIPTLATAVGALNEAQAEGVAAVTPGTSFAAAQAHVRAMSAAVAVMQPALAATREAGRDPSVDSLPGSELEPNLASIRIGPYPVESIDWTVLNPPVYQHLAAPLRADLPDRRSVLLLTNLDNSAARLLIRYYAAGTLNLLSTQTVTLAPREATTIVMGQGASMPAGSNGYALVTGDRPFSVAVHTQTLPTATPTATRATPTPTATGPTMTLTPTPTGPTPTATATICPQATPEGFAVEPVTSPTNLMTQTITVRIGNGDAVTVTTQAGTFVATGDFGYTSNPARVTVGLAPNTTNFLTVQAHVRQTSNAGCPYGGYTLSTTTDRTGAPLVIIQQGGVTSTTTPTSAPSSVTATPTETATAPVIPTSTSTPTPTLTPTPTPVTVAIVPSPDAVGYVTSMYKTSNMFDQGGIWAGMDTRPATPIILDGAVQFDLGALPADAKIVSAQMVLMGMSRVYFDPGTGGTWRLNLLDSSVDMNWTQLNYYQIHNAGVRATSPTVLTGNDLIVGETNTFDLTTAAGALQERLRTTHLASFRINLDSSYGIGRTIFGWTPQPALRITYTR
ncbi:MAG: hypothetical protein U0822_00040 [Anaerolineae bacterium]